jgi:basic membrane lipoprotein Med (substrate-binding protein (PBP1-ABC) superfamily)
VLVEYTYDFVDLNTGKQAAMNLTARGSDVNFGVAGPSGSGGILYAAQQGNWVVGVDLDEYHTTFGGGTVPGSNKILTSALKHLDPGVCGTIEDAVNGAFTSGTNGYDLAELASVCGETASPTPVSTGLVLSNGIGLAPYHETNR